MHSNALAQFIQCLEEVVTQSQGNEQQLLGQVSRDMQNLIASDDWLPHAFAQPDSVHYRQYLLHADAADRFSVVSFVWGPGQRTPIHDHGTWGVVGMLRGAEIATSFTPGESGSLIAGEEVTLHPGDVAVVSPQVGDIHMVRNAYADRISISIHAYGANIGKQTRHVFDARSGAPKAFVSGYSSPAA